ncbi:glycosyltransferase family 2 protein [Candidatus Microgenomates bacterium]|nr:MAG: glycosyltransferase family 2 protein [Candidatus Microgenomates bacterium]
MKLSIIIPAFNEEKTIGQMLKRVALVKIPNVIKEIIVVDDGSTDASATVISKFNPPSGGSISNFKSLRHRTNQGKGAAVKTGIENATGDYILIQDADLEYDPSYIPTLLVPILKGEIKVVYGTRLRRWPNIFKEEKSPLFLIHYFGNRFLSFLTGILFGQSMTDMETGYKIFPREVVKNMKLKARSFDFEPEITAKLLKRGFKILEIPIKTTPRGYEEGKKLNTVKDGLIALITLLKYRVLE